MTTVAPHYCSIHAPLPSLDTAFQYREAQACLRGACTNYGIVASTTNTANYQRVWARDSVICGLAGLLDGDEEIVLSFKKTLLLLARCRGPHGEIPSNVAVDENDEVSVVSLGTIVGRVDTAPWFIIGLCNYVSLTGDVSLGEKLQPVARDALTLLDTWEFNNRGLVYCPLSSDWADEYVGFGYVLLTQLLRLWAVQAYAQLYRETSVEKKAAQLRACISHNYWPLHSAEAGEKPYAPVPFQKFLDRYGEAQFWVSSFSPAGYTTHFDFFANSLAVMLGLGSVEQQSMLLRVGNSIVNQLVVALPPAFWPPITKSSREWEQLSCLYMETFKNKPYEYHNGGIWPMVAGWWGIAHWYRGNTEVAYSVLRAMSEMNIRDEGNAQSWGFYEHMNSQTGALCGTRRCTWSAAAPILLSQYLLGRRLFGLEL